MPTKNPRVNITLEDSSMEYLDKLAKEQNKSVAGLAKELILEALDRYEDQSLSDIAEEREEEPTVNRVSHDDAWK